MPAGLDVLDGTIWHLDRPADPLQLAGLELAQLDRLKLGEGLLPFPVRGVESWPPVQEMTVEAVLGRVWITAAAEGIPQGGVTGGFAEALQLKSSCVLEQARQPRMRPRGSSSPHRTAASF